ncbi:cobalt-precorrin-6A reductase [Rhizobium helianthi]|uniref:Cobalt-precorrin-6A reductase n=1 Tax=Rhizobium helianthi TaxID=1132695 RepID=A0ABW4M6I9_9HYPH
MILNSILILGGTTEARELAAKLDSQHRFRLTLSLAGRTMAPVRQPVPTRVGGFGGVHGLAQYLQEQDIDLLIDATHPYAARISTNAVEAAALVGRPLVALRRPGWQQQKGDRWLEVESVEAAVQAPGDEARTLFLALGRQELLPFEQAPQHRYVVRSVDPVEPPLALPEVEYITARGPFNEADELSLLTGKGIDMLVCKNSGGAASYGKIAAARTLGLPVVLIQRPPLPEAMSFQTVDALLAHVDQAFPPQERGE